MINNYKSKKEKNKIFDCITFFDENLLVNARFEILNEVVDYFIICESAFVPSSMCCTTHEGNQCTQTPCLSDIQLVPTQLRTT